MTQWLNKFVPASETKREMNADKNIRYFIDAKLVAQDQDVLIMVRIVTY